MSLEDMFRSVINEPAEMQKMSESAPWAAQQFSVRQPTSDWFKLTEQVVHAVPHRIRGGVDHLWEPVNANRGRTHHARLERGVERVSVSSVAP